MKTIKMPIDRKERILNMFVRTIIFQKPKIQSNKKFYKRRKFKYNNEE